MPKVSICIAVYNVEKYIEQCVRSLFEQTLDDLEYIFVDDASPDASIDVMLRVLEDYPHRKRQVKLLRHETNQGVAVTRKDAIAAATGDYIIHCDPDDWVELDMYEKMYSKAIETNADMVYCDFKYNGLGTCCNSAFQQVTPQNMINCFFDGSIHAGLCNKLWHSEIAKVPRDLPKDIYLCEDMRLNVQYLLESQKCILISAPLYFYRQSAGSVTREIDARAVDCRKKNVMFFNELLKGRQYRKALNSMKLGVLFQALVYGGISAVEWKNLWFSAKISMVTADYSFKQKCLFLIACVNFPLARKLRDVRMKLK